MTVSNYLIALGSNQRHATFGSPRDIIPAALVAMEQSGLAILDSSAVITTIPLGPSDRQYANAAALIETTARPVKLLAILKSIEESFGKRRGRRWSRRVLDIDIILWSEGCFSSAKPALTIPHPAMHQRSFVLGPATEICAQWRDPVSGLTIRQLSTRQKRAKPLDRKA